MPNNPTMPATNGAFSQTRFQSGQVGEYYPTDIAAIPHIVKMIRYRPSYYRDSIYGPSILDPSCGEGIALLELGRLLTEQIGHNVQVYGNEINTDRYAEARKKLTAVSKGCFETLTATHKFPIVFMNPPYNIGETLRLEYEHTKLAYKFVRDLIILVLPRSELRKAEFWRMMLIHYESISIWRMVGEDYTRWGQHVILAKPRSYVYSNGIGMREEAHIATLIERFDKDSESPFPCISESSHPTHLAGLTSVTTTWTYDVRDADYRDMPLKNQVPNYAEVREAIDNKFPDRWHTSRFLEMMQPAFVETKMVPAMPCRRGLAVQRAVAGSYSGITVELYPNHQFSITGHWRKYINKRQVEDKDKSQTFEAQQIAYAMTCFSLNDGYTFTIDSEKNQEAYEKFMDEHLDHMIEAVEKTSPPRYGWDDWKDYLREFRLIQAPRDLDENRDKELKLFPAQMHVVAGLLKLYEDKKDGNRNAILMGETGSGKTAISAALMGIRGGFFDGKNSKVVVVCPGPPIPKWIDELYHIFALVPNFQVFHIGREQQRRVTSPFTTLNHYGVAEEVYRLGAKLRKMAEKKGKKADIEREIEVLQNERTRIAGAFDAPLGIKHALLIHEYKYLAGKTRTEAEEKRFAEMSKTCVPVSYTPTDFNTTTQKEWAYRAPVRGKAVRYLVPGTKHTYRVARSCVLAERPWNHEERTGLLYIPIPTYTEYSTTHPMPILDTVEAMAHDGPAVLIMTYQTMKNGAPWHHSFTTREQEVTWTEITKSKGGKEHKKQVTRQMRVHLCPDCGQILADPDTHKPWTSGDDRGDTFKVSASGRRAMVCPNTIEKGHLTTGGAPHGQYLNGTEKRQLLPGEEWQAVKCGATLYSFDSFAYGGRYPVARFLADNYAGQYYAILDEAHHTKGGETAVGFASAELINKSVNSVLMTGTLSNGYARSLFYILYRCDWRFRKTWNYHDVVQFVFSHGLVERITTTRHSPSTSAHGGYNTTTSTTEHEIPGTSPALVQLLSPISAYIRKDDLGLEMPERVEIAVPVELGALEDAYSTLVSFRAQALQAYRFGKIGPLQRLRMAMLGWPDNPVEEYLQDLGAVNGVPMPKDGYPKDQAVVKLTYKELTERRGVSIFVEQVNRRDSRQRIVDLLAAQDIYAAILDVKVKPEQRMVFIDKIMEEAARRGQAPVVVMNGNLVKEGVDMLAFPTTIETGQQLNVIDLRQRLNRAYRVGQRQEVRIYHIVYANTIQQQTLYLIARKLAAMDAMTGDVPAGLARYNPTGEGLSDHFIFDLMEKAENTAGAVNLSEIMQVIDLTDIDLSKPLPQLAAEPEPEEEPIVEIAAAMPKLTPGVVDLATILSAAAAFHSVPTKRQDVEQFTFL